MSSSTNSKPEIDRSTTSKGRGAVIRPVNHKSGHQRFIRIDPVAENVVNPKARSLKLDDYIAQIRGEHSAGVRADAIVPDPDPIVEETSIRQQKTTRELTKEDQIDVLQALAKLDAGYDWIAESNRSAALETMDIAEQIAAAAPIVAANEDTGLLDLEDSSVSPISQDLVNSIATAIASVLTDKPEHSLHSKVQTPQIPQPKVAKHTRARSSQPVEVAPTEPVVSDDTLRLSPELPRPGYTLPVTEYDMHVENVRTETPAPMPSAPPAVSLTAAAWTVPAFRWPKVSDLILAHDGVIGGLAANCDEILSPFGKTIAVTAPSRGQGTSTMSITLARIFGASNKRVLLVDADLTNPTLSKTIGLEGVSWFSIDTPTAPIGESIIHGRLSDICVMPLAAPINGLQPHNIPVFDELESKLNQIKSEFDLIVIDAGPVWQIVDEISHNSHLIDVAMIVNQDTQTVGFSAARERLMDRGIFKFIAAKNSFARQAG